MKAMGKLKLELVKTWPPRLVFCVVLHQIIEEKTKNMANKKAPLPDVENSVITRSVIIACAVLSGLFILLLFLQDNLAKIFGQYADEMTIGLMLLSLWLVVSSSIRSVNHLAKTVETWKLLLVGVLIGFISAVLTTAFLILFPGVAKSQNMQEVTGATGAMILVMAGIAFVVSLISVVNIRVRNRSLGNLLEVLIVLAVIGGLVWWATKS